MLSDEAQRAKETKAAKAKNAGKAKNHDGSKRANRSKRSGGRRKREAPRRLSLDQAKRDSKGVEEADSTKQGESSIQVASIDVDDREQESAAVKARIRKACKDFKLLQD